MVRAACQRILGANSLVDDAIQETFLQALRTPPPVQDGMAGWLHRVAVNTCRDLLRREQAQHRRAARSASNSLAATDMLALLVEDEPLNATLVQQRDTPPWAAVMVVPPQGLRVPGLVHRGWPKCLAPHC